MTLWAISLWMNWKKQNRHDRNHACSTKMLFYEHCPNSLWLFCGGGYSVFFALLDSLRFLLSRDYLTFQPAGSGRADAHISPGAGI